MAKQTKKSGLLKPFCYVILIVVLVSILLPMLFKSLKFGLDLQGGFEVLYSVSSLDGEEVTSSMVTSTYKTMLKRIDNLGVSEPEIVVEGNNRIRVQLAGVTNSEEARKLLSSAANLTFRDTSNNLLMTNEVLKSGGARVGQDSQGKPAVSLSISDLDKFYKVTKKISEAEDNRIVIWLDYEEGDTFSNSTCGATSTNGCLSVATVSQGFASDVIIQGNFTNQEVEDLVDLINSGSLSTKLTEISSKTVAASFGEDTLNNTLVAGLIGIAIVILVLILLYRFAGFIASISILLYTLLVFLIFWVLGGVLTLPGIAAVLIGIGMAVDANVLNFTRIKDELNSGKSFKNAFIEGNKESLGTVIDANVTTLLVAIILFIFGESSVKGFATMLIISIVVTLFVMVFLTRKLLGQFVKTGYFDQRQKLFIGFKNTNKEVKKKERSYLSLSKYFITFSISIIILGIVFFGGKGFNLGIDFKGGTSINLQLTNNIDERTLKHDIEKLDLTLEKLEYLNDTNVNIIVDNQLEEEQVIETEKYFQDKYQANTDISVVSNVVKQELIINAIYAFILSIIGIIIYMSFRFKFSYAISGLIALLHDIIIVFAVFSIFHFEISTIFIAAILSVLGYSINDTIVVFDRIRENLKDKKIKTKDDLKSIVNLSIKQTINRSIVTTLTTIIPVITLIIFGSAEILNFNMALLIGFIVGVYSSLFISTYLWIKIESRNLRNKKVSKKTKKEPEELSVKGINS